MIRMLNAVIMSFFIAFSAACGARSSNQTVAYIIIDISAGPDATTYPVVLSQTAPEDLNSDLYKTDRIGLRRIPAGTFMQGSPEGELGRRSFNEHQHKVSLSEDYYLGVFQVTQRQWLNVIGGINICANKGDTRPVELVSWDEVRGGVWDGPEGGEPDPNTFVGRLLARTGLGIDLPTESQWEYAARAGTTTALNNGENLTDISTCTSLNELGLYRYNAGLNDQHAVVGSYAPNAWDIYDMHGNVWEWCLDRYQINLGADPVIDPVGPSSKPGRVLRGGGWGCDARACRSANRGVTMPSRAAGNIGFRLASQVKHVSSSGDR